MVKPKNKITVAAISLIVLVLGLIAGIALVRRVQEVRERAAPPPAPNVVVSPETQSVNQGGSLSFTARSDSGTNKVSSVQLFVTYDPSSFEVTSVTQGSGITGFSEFINEIDNTTGRIRYVASVLDPASSVQGSDLELIAVNGNVKPGAADGSYPMSFDTGTKLLDDTGVNLNVNIAGGIVYVGPPTTGTPSPTGELMIDNFEGYGGSNSNLLQQYTYNVDGNSAALSLSTSYKGGGGDYSAKLDYTTGNPEYSGVWSRLSSDKKDWTNYDSLKFWFRGDSSRRKVIVQFSEEDGDHWEAYPTITKSVPFEYSILFSKFVKPSWNTGSGNGVMELDNMSGFAFYVTSPTAGSGTVYFDNFRVLKTIFGTPTPTLTPTPTVTPGPTATNTPTPSPTTAPTPTTPPVSADTQLYLTTVGTTKQMDREFTIDLMINTGVNQVVGTEVYMSFDTNKLQVISIVPGPFIPNPVERINIIDNTEGSIAHVLLVPTDDDPVNGTGILATLTFKAIAEGVTTINITGETIVGALGTNYQNALKSRRGITITIVRPSLPGDINDMGTYCGDGVVNILDYTILYDHFWEEPSTHPCADINEDGIVNTLDYVVLYENFGRTL